MSRAQRVRPVFGAVAGLVAAAVTAACDGLPDGAASDASAPSDANFALHFNGTTDYATTGTGDFPTGGTPQTISFWARPSAYSGTQVVLVLRRDERSGVNVGIRNGAFAAWTISGDTVLTQERSPPDAGGWHHVAYVFDVPDGGGVATLYVDGAVASSAAATPNGQTPLSSWIGSYDGLQEFYAGDVDELRVWAAARSPAEVLEDMAGTVDGDASDLVAYFDFNAVSETTVPDLSGHGNDATLGGGDLDAAPTRVPSTVP